MKSRAQKSLKVDFILALTSMSLDILVYAAT